MPPSTKPRVRFAPSPTGYLHVGGARTALFNWLFARHEGGTLLLRVEDTDVARNRPELTDGILESLRWMGLDWDEGPYFQSRRLPLYQSAVERLLTSGAAYPCYCQAAAYAGADSSADTESEESAEDIEAESNTFSENAAAGPSTGPPKPPQKNPQKAHRAPPCPCRNLTAAERTEKAAQNLPHAVRFAAPHDGITHFEDAVFGPRDIQNSEIEDFVLLRSTGLPTYQLGAVTDDIDMGITHVIRGADHLSNTPKQVLLYKALGATPPIFAHVPLILGADRTRMSKRHGATSVGSYQQEGFLPEAFRNFLALLGWSTGDDSEFLRTDELVPRFTLAGVSRTNAIFDRAKLEWFNTQYLQKIPVEDLLPAVENELRRAGIWREEWNGSQREWFKHVVDLLRPRIRLLPDFATWGRGFFSDDFEYDAAAREKFWKDPALPDLLQKLTDQLSALPEWNHDACDHALRGVAADAGVKAGLLINATRVALVGRAVAPPLFETMLVLGKDRVIARLRCAIPALVAH
jgi:glutamyl-tRNA synthetase